jgi:hypothetical protein
MRPLLLVAFTAPVLAAALACASSRPQASGPAPTAKGDSVGVAPSDTARSGAAPSDAAQAGAAPRGAKPPTAAAPGRPTPHGGSPSTPAADSVRRVAPPEVAHAHGWMPLASTGVDRFLRAQPEADGRGVLIGILDTGIDPGVPGLLTTSTGGPKILDLRDFSGEGAVALARVTPAGDSVEVGGRRLGGFGRVMALNTAGPYYAGTIAELPLGPPPAADLNGNGAVRDTLPIVVVRATDGWVLLADTDGDGSLAGERPIHDYLAGRESFGWAPKGGHPRVNVAANFGTDPATPQLDLYFDTADMERTSPASPRATSCTACRASTA